MLADYEHLATGRKHSSFAEDLEDNRAQLHDRTRGSRIAIIGAAGSIGFSVVRNILEFEPAGMVLIDLSENNLVEVVRELRSSHQISVPEDFCALPIGVGSIECTRFFQETASFDYILNLSAVKHVRSEKDVFCLAHMIDTNVLFIHDLLESIPYDFQKFFSVSSDKAANPASLMGASKMIMEEMLRCQRRTFSTARFANVAFSDGSLPYGFIQRIEKRQPISAPNDVKRYFMSHEEAGQICLLSCVLGENADVFFPKLQQRLNEATFSEVAVRLLSHLGYDPVECASENKMRPRIEQANSFRRANGPAISSKQTLPERNPSRSSIAQTKRLTLRGTRISALLNVLQAATVPNGSRPLSSFPGRPSSIAMSRKQITSERCGKSYRVSIILKKAKTWTRKCSWGL